MKVYELSGNSDLSWVNTVVDGDALKLDKASHLGEKYTGSLPVVLEYSDTDSSIDWLAVDCVRAPAYGTALFSEKAVSVLQDDINKNGYLIPVVLSVIVTYFIFVPTTKIDAIDQYKSKTERFSYGGISRIVKLNLDFSSQPNVPNIFQLIGNKSTIYVTSVFVDRVISSGLSGFKFREVWPLSDHDAPVNVKAFTSGVAHIPYTDDSARYREQIHIATNISFARNGTHTRAPIF